MYNKIVVSLDGSGGAERSIHPAVTMADQLACPLEFVIVHKPGMDAGQAQDYLQEVIASNQPGPALVARVEQGDPGQVISGLVSEEPNTLLCMASTGQARSGQLLGSVAERVLRRSPSPILLVGPRVESTANRFFAHDLVVATDGSDVSERIMKAAAEFAGAFAMTPWIVSVSDPKKLVTAAVDAQLETNSARRHAHLFDTIPHPEIEWEVLHDAHPDQALTRFAAERDAGAIAMSTHAHTGLQRLAVGSVTMSVVHKAHSPVLVVGPGDQAGS